MWNGDPKKYFFAGGFLFNPQTKSVLLHLRDGKTKVNPNKWGFFGGMNEGQETPKECCVREFREELSLDLKENQLIPLCDYLNIEANTWRYVFYIESQKSKSEMILGEGAGFEWISLDKVMEYNLTDLTREDLQKFIKKIN